MAIDASIAMGYQPVKLDNPMNSLAQLMQLQNAQSQNRLADLTFQQHEQELANTNALNSAYQSAIGPDGKVDRTKLIQTLAQKNLGSKIPAVQKSLLDADEAQQKVDKGGIELFDAAMKGRRDALAGVSTPEQYLAWHQANHADPILGPMLAKRGITLGSAQAALDEALKTPGGLQALINQSALGMTKFAELNKPTIHTVNSGKVSTMYSVPGMGGDPTAINTTQMTTTPDADLTDSRTRSEGVLNRRQAADLASQGVSYQTGANGEIIALPSKSDGKTPIVARTVIGSDGKPVQGSGNKPSAEYLKTSEAYRNMDDALTDYMGKLSSFGKLDMLSPSARADMGQAYSNAMLQAKEMYKLGVLNGGDERILKTIIDSPIDFKNAVIPVDALMKQANQLQSIVQRNNANLSLIHKQPAAPLASEGKKAATSIPAVNSKGWALHTDASGNRAYVSPDGKSFEEVK